MNGDVITPAEKRRLPAVDPDGDGAHIPDPYHVPLDALMEHRNCPRHVDAGRGVPVGPFGSSASSRRRADVVALRLGARAE